MPATSIRSTTRSRRRAMAEINVVPYIDVMLVLLVIFMVTAPLVTPSIINLPSVGNAALAQHAPPITLNIHANGGLSIRYQNSGRMREDTLSKAELQTFLQKQQNLAPDQPVVIAADKNLQYQTVMSVMSDLKIWGIKRVGLYVQASK
ncbi:protein TolR [Mycoavidus sp. B2-EB]|uniref:protein TolR n=1 Tax=Mycoavidus sp. B2-EB TaxID=2651972 RepID=UPI001628E23B|nr:protein TolR [Mycoavidus sp. B2-EB]BBO60103.1 TolR-like protein [Mycoavidus sp. B2-EB]